MANITYIKCPNSSCGTILKLNLPVEIVIKKVFDCPICKTRFAIKDALYNPDTKKKNDTASFIPQDKKPDACLEKQNQESDNHAFCNGVILFKNDNGYPYLFFSSKTTFGRYDETMQADILCLTDDTTMSRRHICINIDPCCNGLHVSLTNLSKSICKVEKVELRMGETVELADGMNIRLGNTTFTIRDLNKNDI